MSLALDWVFLTFLGYASFMAGVSLLLQADARVLIWPWPNVSAYCTTVFIYAATGVWYFQKFRWKAVIPLAAIGLLQEGLWTSMYFTLYPGFVDQAMAASSSWVVYVLSLFVAAPVVYFLQRRWFRIDTGHFLLTAAGFGYMVLYYFIGMPVFFQYTGVPHTPTLLPESLFVVASVALYMGLARLEKRE